MNTIVNHNQEIMELQRKVGDLRAELTRLSAFVLSERFEIEGSNPEMAERMRKRAIVASDFLRSCL